MEQEPQPEIYDIFARLHAIETRSKTALISRLGIYSSLLDEFLKEISHPLTKIKKEDLNELFNKYFAEKQCYYLTFISEFTKFYEDLYAKFLSHQITELEELKLTTLSYAFRKHTLEMSQLMNNPKNMKSLDIYYDTDAYRFIQQIFDQMEARIKEVIFSDIYN